MMAIGAADFDLSRFGMEVFRASPRQADLMIVAGRVSQKMAPVLRQVYDQMMEPKWVISMGVCASTGGMFNNYAIVQGVDQIVPVDVYAPGCPPSPETLMHAILTLHEKIRTGEITAPRDGAGGAAPRGARRLGARAPRRGPAGNARGERRRRRRSNRRSPTCPGRRRWTAHDRAASPTATATTTWSPRSATPGFEMLRRPLRRRLPRAPRARAARRASTPERFEVVVNLLSSGAGPRGCASGCRCPRTTAVVDVALRPLPRGRGHGARGVRHVRHLVHRATRT